MKDYPYRPSFPLPLTKEEEEECLIKMKQGDKEAKDKLIMHNMRLVAHIAKKYYLDNENEDLISIGYFGLVKGLEHFKMEKKIKLTSYLGKCIENEILMELRRVRTRNKYVPLEDKSDKTHTDKLIKALAVDDLITKISTFLNEDQVLNYLSCLNELEMKVIVLRYGLLNNPPHTQTEIASILKYTRSYISHIEKNALQKMREKAILDESLEIINNLYN